MGTRATGGRQAARIRGPAARFASPGAPVGIAALGLLVAILLVAEPSRGAPADAAGAVDADAVPAVVTREVTEALFRLLKDAAGPCRLDGLSAGSDRMTATLCEGATCATAELRAGGACEAAAPAAGLCPEPDSGLTDACRAAFLAAVSRLDGELAAGGNAVASPAPEGQRRPAPTTRVAWHTRIVQGAWILLALLCVAIAWRSPDRRRLLPDLAVLFVVAFALRWVLGPWGPGDVRINLMPGADYEWDFRWGHAPVALYRLLGGDPSERAIQGFGIVLTSFAPLFLHGTMRSLGFGRAAAFGAGLAAAAMPFLILFSSVISRVPSFLFAGTAGLWLAASFVRSGGSARAAGAVIAGVLATLSRPEGGIVLALAVPLMLAVDGTARRRWIAAGAAVALGAAALAYLLATCTENMTGLFDGGPRGRVGLGAIPWSILFGAEFTPVGFVAVGAVGLAVRWRDRRAWLVLALLAVLEVAWVATPVGGYFIELKRLAANARYQVVLILPLAVAVALAVDWAASLAPKLRAAALALMAGACVATFGPAVRESFVPRAPDFEYRFLRDHVATLGEAATVYYLRPPTDIGFIEPFLVRDPGGSRGPLWVPLTAATCAGAAGRGDAYYYDGSHCNPRLPNHWKAVGPRMQALERRCREVRDALPERPEAVVEVPARPYSWYLYRDPVVRLARYRMGDLPCEALFPATDTDDGS